MTDYGSLLNPTQGNTEYELYVQHLKNRNKVYADLSSHGPYPEYYRNFTTSKVEKIVRKVRIINHLKWMELSTKS